MSLLKRPFGQQAGMEANEMKNKKPKPNDAQAWTTPYTGSFFFICKKN